jgi:hypothetical protein
MVPQKASKMVVRLAAMKASTMAPQMAESLADLLAA